MVFIPSFGQRVFIFTHLHFFVAPLPRRNFFEWIDASWVKDWISGSLTWLDAGHPPSKTPLSTSSATWLIWSFLSMLILFQPVGNAILAYNSAHSVTGKNLVSSHARPLPLLQNSIASSNHFEAIWNALASPVVQYFISFDYLLVNFLKTCYGQAIATVQ